MRNALTEHEALSLTGALGPKRCGLGAGAGTMLATLLDLDREVQARVSRKCQPWDGLRWCGARKKARRAIKESGILTFPPADDMRRAKTGWAVRVGTGRGRAVADEAKREATLAKMIFLSRVQTGDRPKQHNALHRSHTLRDGTPAGSVGSSRGSGCGGAQR